MADDEVILQAGATINIAPYEANIDKMVAKTAAAMGAIKGSFAELAAADAAVNAQVAQGGAGASDKWSTLAAAQIRAATASRLLRESVNDATASGLIPEEEAVQQVAGALYEATVATEAFKAAQDAATASSERMTGGVRNARIAFTGLTQDIGVRGSRVLASFLGQSETIGPILQRAFSVVAIIAAVEIIGQLVAKIREATDALVGYTAEVKKAEQENIRASQAAETHAGSVIDAETRLQAAVRLSGQLAQESWIDKAKEGIEVTQKQQSAWWNLIPPVRAAIDVYNSLAGAIRGVDLAADRAARNTQVQIALTREVSRQQSEVSSEQLKRAEGELNIKKIGETRVQQLNQEIAAQKQLETIAISRAVKEAASKPEATGEDIITARQRVQQEFEIKTSELRRQLSVATTQELVANEKASIEARKTVDDAYISYYVSGLKELFTAGKINLDAEVDGENAAVEAKLEEDRRYAREKLALLALEAKTGKNVQPEVESVNAQLLEKEVAAASQIDANNAKRDEERITHANSVSLALAEATRSSVEAQAEYTKQASKLALDSQKIDIDEYVAKVKTDNAVVIASDRDVLTERLRIASVNPYKNQTEIIAIQQQLTDMTKKQLTEEAALDAEAAKKHVEEARKASEEVLRVAEREANERLAIAKHSDDVRLRDHDLSLAGWAQAERTTLDRWKADELAALEAFAAEQRRIFGEGSLEYKKAKDEELKVEQKWREDVQRIDDQLGAEFQKTMNVIGSSWNSAFDKMLTEKTKFSTVMESFWNEMVRGWARMAINLVGQWVEAMGKILIQAILQEAHLTTIHAAGTAARQANENLWTGFLTLIGLKRTTTATTQEAAQTSAHAVGVAARQAADAAGSAESIVTNKIKNETIVQGEAGAAAAAGFASVMEALPFPANVAAAPGVAAGAAAQVEAFGAIAAAAQGVAAGDRGMPAIVHPGELITHSDVLSSVAVGAPTTSAAAALVLREQMVHLAPGAVVIPAAHAPGITNAIQMTGGTIETAPGVAKPGGIKEVPQRLSESMVSALKDISSRYTFTSAREGYFVSSALRGMSTVSSAVHGMDTSSAERVTSSRDGYSSTASGVDRLFSARQEYFSSANRLVFAREGYSSSAEHFVSSKEGYVSARSGYSSSAERSVSAREGYSTERLLSASDGYSNSSFASAREGYSTTAERVLSSREGYTVPGAASGMVTERSVSSAREGFSAERFTPVSAKDGFSLSSTISAREGFFNSTISAHEGFATDRSTISAREGFSSVSAREGFSTEHQTISAREGFSTEHLISSSRDGYIVPSAASGMNVERYVNSAREGFIIPSTARGASNSDQHFSSAREGMSTASITSAREGFIVPGASGGVATSSMERISSATGGMSVDRLVSVREGFAVPSIAGGTTVDRSVLSAREGFSNFSDYTISSARSAREGFIVPGAAGGMTVKRFVSSAREGFVAIGAARGMTVDRFVNSAREGGAASSSVQRFVSAREGFAVPGAAGGMSISSTERIVSSREGFIVPGAAGGMHFVSSAREGTTIISSVRDGFIVPSAVSGFSLNSTERLPSAAGGFSSSSVERFSSAREGFVLPSAAGGIAIRSAAGGLSTAAALSGASTSFAAPPALTTHFAAPEALTNPAFGGSRSAGGSASSSTVNNHTVNQTNEINLHHAGPDAREVLEKELAPRVKRLMRTGVLPSP